MTDTDIARHVLLKKINEMQSLIHFLDINIYNIYISLIWLARVQFNFQFPSLYSSSFCSKNYSQEVKNKLHAKLNNRI